MLLGVQQIVTLLSEVVAIGLTPQPVGEPAEWQMQPGHCSWAHGIVGVKWLLQSGAL